MIEFTDRQLLIKAVSVLVRYAKHLDDANPDVGMGPGFGSLVDTVIKQLPGLNLTFDEIECIREYYDQSQ